MKPLMRLMVVVGSVALMPALLFAGPAAAAKGGSKATVQECKDHGAAFGNVGQCVSGANPTQAPGPAPSIQIEDPALLLPFSGNKVFMTVDYLCLPGSDGKTAGTLLTDVIQGQTKGTVITAPATCDGSSHTASTVNGPGPFNSGPATGFAQVFNSDGQGIGNGGAPITIKAPEPAMSVRNKALLLTDGTVIVTADYLCPPGSDGSTAATLTTSLRQGGTVGSSTTAPATCDDRSHTATTDNGPGPFSEGPALGVAQVENSDGLRVSESGAPITISSFVPPAGPASR